MGWETRGRSYVILVAEGVERSSGTRKTARMLARMCLNDKLSGKFEKALRQRYIFLDTPLGRMEVRYYYEGQLLEITGEGVDDVCCIE